MSNSNYTFEQWCKDNKREDILDRWDNELNNCLPSEIMYMSNNKYYFKCPKGIHESQTFTICDLHKSKYPLMKCKKCNSFAQHIISDFGEEYFRNIWNSNNTLDPWNIPFKSNKEVLFNCTNSPSHTYSMSLYKYSSGVGCPYCSHHRINKDNSLGKAYPQVLHIWSNKNDKTPYEFAPVSGQKVWWKCEKNIHKDYYRKISISHKQNFVCPECGRQNGYMNRKEDLSGQVFGQLTAVCIDMSNNNKRRTYWICQCSCGKKCSVDVTNLKTGNTTTCGDRSAHYSGQNNGHWKGGVTPDLILARNSKKYDKWREEVYKKCWFTCQCCGESKGIIKNAHHIKNFSENIDERYDVDNGILLCEKCHAFKIPGSFHYVYGCTKNTPDQLEEYINNKRDELKISKRFHIQKYMNGDVVKPNTIIRRVKNG